MKRRCTYLRVIATTRCNLSCSYCHAEGDPQHERESPELPFDDLAMALDVASGLGIRKYKFLGGEPLLRSDLPDVVRHLRHRAPFSDLSVITAGVLPSERLAAAYDAGLTRANVTVHGFAPQALAQRIPKKNAFELRSRFLDYAMSTGKPLKLNYVYSSVFERDDLGALLAWAAGKPVLVNVLDNLNKDWSWRNVADALVSLRGEPERVERCEDPDSLDTAHWLWTDGLRVEPKDRQLGQLAPWRSCETCPNRARCKEGIYALRLDHFGNLQPCMDRTDLSFPLVATARELGVCETIRRAADWMEAL